MPSDTNETMIAIVMLDDLHMPSNNALSRDIRARLPDVSLPNDDAKGLLFFRPIGRSRGRGVALRACREFRGYRLNLAGQSSSEDGSAKQRRARSTLRRR